MGGHGQLSKGCPDNKLKDEDIKLIQAEILRKVDENASFA
jgi:hypothetical protein